MYDIKGLVVLESSRLRERLKMTSSQLGVNEKITADLWSSIPSAERSELAARVDVEKKVSFYPHPLTYNWSPFVLDSSKATLPELENNRFVPSASLPETCQALYANITSPGQTRFWTGPTASLDCRTPSPTASAQKARFFSRFFAKSWMKSKIKECLRVT